jgi:hypothetical protein
VIKEWNSNSRATQKNRKVYFYLYSVEETSENFQASGAMDQNYKQLGLKGSS